MKENLDYYTHDANADESPKFKALRVRFGWAGEGRFWALNNRIAKATGCWLNLAKPYVKSTVACDLGLTIGEFDELVTFLANPDECGLLIRKGDRITTDRVQEAFAKIMTDRQSARKRKKGSSPESYDSSDESPDSSPEPGKRAEQSREEERKLEQQQEDNLTQIETPAQAPAAAAGLSETIRGHLEPKGISYDAATIDEISRRLAAEDLGEDFVDFAVHKAEASHTRNPSAFLRKALLTFDDWIAEYRVGKRRAKKRDAATAPKACPECGTGPPAFGSGTGWAMCKACGGEWQLREGSWMKIEPAATG